MIYKIYMPKVFFRVEVDVYKSTYRHKLNIFTKANYKASLHRCVTIFRGIEVNTVLMKIRSTHSLEDF